MLRIYKLFSVQNSFTHKNKSETKLKLTEIVFLLPFISASFIQPEQNTPEMIDDDERRCQRRLVVVLLGQAVSIEAPRLDADVLHRLKRVAATTHHNCMVS